MMGLASGMDTDFIIQQTLRMHQFKIDNQMRNKKLIEWRQQSHNTIKDELTSLRQTFLSNLGSKSMMNRNVFNATAASISGTHSSAVSIRTNAGSPLGNFSIQAVNKLATGRHLTTTGGVSSDKNGFATTARLGDLNFGAGNIEWTEASGSIRVGNENIRIERNHETNSFVFRNAAGADITDSVVSSNGGNSFTINAGGTSRTINWDAANNLFTEGTGEFVRMFPGVVAQGGGDPQNVGVSARIVDGAWEFITNFENATANIENDRLIIRVSTVVPGENGEEDETIEEVFDMGVWDPDNKTLGGVALQEQQQLATSLTNETVLTFNTGSGNTNVRISANDTLSEMLSRVNNQVPGVNMSYDRLTDRFTLEARTGTHDPRTTTLDISSNSNFFNLISGSAGPITMAAGERAEVWINGTKEFFNSNSFNFRGVSVTLNDKFNETYNGAGPVEEVRVNLARDTTPAFNAIKDFIDSYNSIIRRLEGLLNERKTGSEASYRPLTDEEKQGMTEKQIEEWEAIARKGIMRNDQGIRNLVSSLRASFFEQIEGAGISPSQIGLSTGNFFDGTGGQIIINEERLRDALERDPDLVADVFIRIDTSDGSPRGVGLLHKIDGLMRDFVNTTQTNSIKGLEDSLKRANEQIQRMQERMFAEEDRLYRVFASMESAMQKLNQQGSWFSSMLGQ